MAPRRFALLFVLVAVVLLGTTACSSSSKARPEQPPANLHGKKHVYVDAKDDLFTPPTILVDKGTTVTWTNKDAGAHNVKKAAGRLDFGAPFGIDADKFGPGKSYSFTFTKQGTFYYRCTIHAGMTGKVVVGTGQGVPIITVPRTTTTKP